MLWMVIRQSDALVVEVDGEWKKAEQWSFSARQVENDFARPFKGNIWIHSVGRLIKGGLSS